MTITKNGKICVLSFCPYKNRVMSDNTTKHRDPLILNLLYKMCRTTQQNHRQ